MAFDTNQIAQVGSLLTSFNSQPQKRCITTVNGYKEAQDFRLNHGESILFLDSNADVLYVKECDDIGKCSLKVFSCKDITTEYQLQNTPVTLSKADLDNFQTNILSEVKKLLGDKNAKLNAEK